MPRIRRSASSLGFGTRLALTLMSTLAVVGGVGYEVMSKQLEGRLIEQYAAEHAADIKSIEQGTRHTVLTGHVHTRVADLIDAIAARPGVIEVLLIDSRKRVVEAHDHGLRGSTDWDPRIAAAMRTGAVYAGPEADPTRDSENFEFVAPIELSGERHALEMSYDHRFFDSQMRALRHSMLLVMALGLFGGAAVFYLLGGRSLIRTHRRALERATRDGLTDLGNQRAFQQELQQAVGLASRHGEALSLLMVDLDDFKFLNDRHGHRHGDRLLIQLAGLLGSGRLGDRGFRVGGDEFALLLPHAHEEGARHAARRLQRACSEVGISISVGLSELRPGQDAVTLHEESDAALYEAKRRGGKMIVGFAEIRDRVSITTPDKVRAVRSILEAGEIPMAFQPIWDLEKGVLLGVEALARPPAIHDLSGPAEAFDIAQEIRRVHELDQLCVRSALSHAPELPPDAFLFINIAPQTLDLSLDRDAWLAQAVADAGLRPEEVVIEVTERFGGRTASVVKGLARLREQGFKVALDDVGTGNSGLDMLRQVPVEFVKIDRSVVAGAVSEGSARGVLLALATFARQTGAVVIAEGIEDEETLEFIRGLDTSAQDVATIIQGAQGFGLGRPELAMPPGSTPLLTATVPLG
jgi:diguanylate cyclase (GGDEF)-like protein